MNLFDGGDVNFFYLCIFKSQIFISPALGEREKTFRKKCSEPSIGWNNYLGSKRKRSKFLFVVDLPQVSKDFIKSQGKIMMFWQCDMGT